jgi:hypothetical protein
MNSPKHLHSIFHERREYLLSELRMIDLAIRCAQQNEEAINWLERLECWRADLQKCVEDMPEP